MYRLKHRRPRKYSEPVISDSFIKKEREKYKHSVAWLQKAIKFNHGKLPSADTGHLIEQLFGELITDDKGYKWEQKLLDLEILIANLNQKRNCISVSLTKNDWYSSMCRKAGLFTLELIKKLKEKGYIEMEKVSANFLGKIKKILLTIRVL